jgi:O-acetyl-ADP-ribose deacetylase (regulator of RNase III)
VIERETEREPVRIGVRLGDIVKQVDCDAIVNSANQNLRAGSGVCGAIHAAAGPKLETCSHALAPLGLAETVATPGFRLPNRIVIHVRGPKYHFDPDPERYLARAIRNVLLLADRYEVVRVAVPGISMGVYAYPPAEAVPILVRTAYATGDDLHHLQEIRFVVMDRAIQTLFEEQIAQWKPGAREEVDAEVSPEAIGKVISPRLIDAVRATYRLAWSGIHGVSHWARVRKVGLQLAGVTGARPDVVELFAFLHDSCRHGDGRDPDHGRRAVEFARRLRGECFSLDDKGFALLCEAMEFHSKGLMDADVTVQTCWDADRLDLGRVDIQPEAERLCTDAARQWLKSESGGLKPARLRE